MVVDGDDFVDCCKDCVDVDDESMLTALEEVDEALDVDGLVDVGGVLIGVAGGEVRNDAGDEDDDDGVVVVVVEVVVAGIGDNIEGAVATGIVAEIIDTEARVVVVVIIVLGSDAKSLMQ